MLGLALIYFLGKWYANLAEDFNKNKWLYAIVGIATYYVGTFAAGFAIGILSAATNNNVLLGYSDFVLGLICLPFGIISTVLLRYLLKRNWRKNSKISGELLDDTELI